MASLKFAPVTSSMIRVVGHSPFSGVTTYKRNGLMCKKAFLPSLAIIILVLMVLAFDPTFPGIVVDAASLVVVAAIFGALLFGDRKKKGA